jgi:hypothetical protein
VRRLEDRLRRWPLGDQALLSKEGRRQARAGKALGREPDLNGAVVKVDSPARRAAKDKKRPLESGLLTDGAAIQAIEIADRVRALRNPA